MPSLKLTYFDSPGRAEPIRVALFMVGLPFEDHRLKFPQYMESKARGDFPLGAVPVLEVDGVKFTQTAAMLRYVAKIGGGSLYPADPLVALRVDSALDSFNDTLSHALMPSLFERDPAKKLAMRADFAAGPMKLVFTYAEGLLEGSDGPFFGGQALSVADLVAALQVLQIRSGTLDGITADMLSPYPRLNALADAYLADERVIAYRSR